MPTTLFVFPDQRAGQRGTEVLIAAKWILLSFSASKTCGWKIGWTPSNLNVLHTDYESLLRRADRVSLGDRASEFHVVIDRTRPIDFEVYQIKSVTGYGESVEEEQQIRPFYLARDLDLEGSAVFTVNRLPRVLSEKERRFGQATSYAGGDISLFGRQLRRAVPQRPSGA